MSEIEKRRNKRFSVWLISTVVIFIYLVIILKVNGLAETIKYLILLAPVFFVPIVADLFLTKAGHYHKGIVGEDKVERILKELNIDYQRNIRDITGKFDYDFHAIINKKHYILEVKNRSRYSKKIINEALKQAKGNAYHYRQNFLGEELSVFVEPLVILVGDQNYTKYKGENILGINLLEKELAQLNNRG